MSRTAMPERLLYCRLLLRLGSSSDHRGLMALFHRSRRFVDLPQVQSALRRDVAVGDHPPISGLVNNRRPLSSTRNNTPANMRTRRVNNLLADEYSHGSPVLLLCTPSRRWQYQQSSICQWSWNRAPKKGTAGECSPCGYNWGCSFLPLPLSPRVTAP